MTSLNCATFVDLLSYRSLSQPNQIAYTFLVDGDTEEVKLTYQELDQKARAIAVELQSLKAAPGERALLLYPSGLEFIVAFFGCLYAGVLAVPVYPPRRNQRMTRLQAIVKDSEARFALTTASVLTNIQQGFAQEPELTALHCIAIDKIVSDASNWQKPPLEKSTLAFLQYTSGSTGTPKGVIVTHGNLLQNSEYIKSAFELTPNSVSVTWLPSFHDMGLIDGVLQPLYTGFPSVMMSPASFVQQPIRWLKAISDYKATHCGGPNFGYELCVSKITPEQRANLDLSSWCSAYSGAEPVRRETLEKFAATFKSSGFQAKFFYPCYGMAEATLMISGGGVADEPVYCVVDPKALEKNQIIQVSEDTPKVKHLVGCGYAWLDTKIAIANPQSLTLCAPEQVGEIWVSGSSIAKGYWNRPEQTKETFHAYLADTAEGPFLRTGDLGFLKDGQLFITGRLKDVVIIRGCNHYPQDIELTVEQSHQALKAGSGAAFSVDIDGEEQLVIVQEVERTYLRHLNLDEVVEAIKTSVSQIHELQVYAVLLLKTGSIPKTSSGKIQRHACRAGFLAGTLNALNTVDVVIEPQLQNPKESKKMQFSLLYFSSNEAEFSDEKYKLFLEGAKFADRNGFTAVWTPERHFHAFGGLYPNPSVLSAALTSLTKRIRLRAGSVVLPLHNPIRVVEEWSVVDNLSHGRVDLAFARGWNPNDFVLSPDTHADSKEVMFSGIQTVQKLWRGENISLPNGVGKQTDIKVYPLPMQRELSIWITCTGGKERFIEAGASGFNILTALLFQPVEELAQKIALYRETRKQHGYDPDSGQVTLMLHTFIGEDIKVVRNQVREPFIEYMKSSVNLWRHGSDDLDKLTETEKANLLAYAFERYFHTSALFGTPSTCLEMVQRLHEIGVDEIACLIDFGIDGNTVLASLDSLNNLRQLVNGVDEPSIKETIESYNQPKTDVLKQTNNAIINNSLPAFSIETSLKIPSRQNEEVQVPQGSLLQWIGEVIVQQIANSLGKKSSQISLDKSFYSFGIDSLKAVEIMETLGEKFGFSISPTLLFEYPTPTEFALYLIQEQKTQLQKYLLVNWEPAKLWAVNLERQKAVVLSNKLFNPASTKVVEPINDRIRAEDIAVIGMSGRFPQSPDLQSFWELLSQGKNAIAQVPSLRWNLSDWYDKNPGAANKTYSCWGGFIDHIDQFDPLFFQISPREAELMDPQQRLFLEVAWEALENAGYSPESFAQSQVGVFVGCSNNGYYQRIAPALNTSDYSAGIGNQNAIIANRVSFLLNLRGPSVLIDTMCSSSLVALHMACRSLQQGECTTALAGGVNLLLSPEYYVGMSRMKMHSPNGRCATFDSQADGIVLGEGAGALLLKPLSQALKDGDRIYAVIKGSAVNHDGRTNGITAPNSRSHAEVICQALDAAGISADTISYVEAHGTGTSLGDPIEVEGLTKAFRKYTERKQFCKIGSVKTNIGHLECAAGMAQLLKVILAIQHRQIPANLHFQQPNPLIPFAETPFQVNTKLCSWESSGLRRAGISSFGIGGTNAHIVIEEAPPLEPVIPEIERPKHLLTFSAKTENALVQLVSRYETYLAANLDLPLGDICFTANTGRSHFQHRLSAIATSTSDLHQRLLNFISQQEVTGIKIGRIHENTPPKIAFLFTGQCSQYVGMGSQLYETQPTFRKILDYCNEILRPYLKEDLLKVIYPQPGETSLIDQTAYAQPALFALEYALVQLWKSWGVEPSVVMGHSVGEYVAACVAGVFSLEDGLKLIAERSRLMQSLPQTGAMVAVFACEADIWAITEIDLAEVAFAPRLEEKPSVGIAAYNGPQNTVISGEREAIERICANLKAAGIQTKKLVTSYGFHSPLMEPILAEFRQVAATVTYNAPQIDIISNVTGQLIGEAINPEYWCDHLISSVQFAKSIQTLHTADYEIFVEIGPKPILLGMGSKCLLGKGLWLASLRQGREDWQQILESLGELYVHGVQVEWSGFDRDYFRRRVQLPTYPFQRKRYWIDAPVSTSDNKFDTQKSLPSQLSTSQFDTEIAPPLKALQPKVDTTPQIKRLDLIVSKLHSYIVNLLKAEPSEVDFYAPFLEIGADSLMLIDAINYIDITYRIKITISQLFEQLTTIYAVASYIDQNLLPEPIFVDVQLPEPVYQTQPPTPQSPPLAFVESNGNGHSHTQQPTLKSTVQQTAGETAVERIMLQQLQVMSQVMSQQLDVLRATGNVLSSNGNSHLASSPPTPQNQVVKETGIAINQVQSNQTVTKNFSPIEPPPPREINQPQQQHLKTLISNYTQKTQSSKQYAQTYRSFLADSRAVAGFRPSTKEMVYPIIGERAKGARCWDIDGNEYVDITMGFGVLLFGHAAPFITAAVDEHLQQGIQIGPQANYAGEVAALISELTGMERVTFCNSGTEAVMTALRLARTKTGRSKIAIFAGSYHGHFDGILAKESLDGLSTVPIAPGITANAVEDVLVLDYGEPKSLEILQAHAAELAAVLVEPVQGRNPDLQPREFLQQLRQFTAVAGVALIFDEVLVGFRIHLGGAQAWFGIEADIVTYGKIVGGSIPIGVVAGKASYMNGIDGGLWNYGDASYPQVEKTFFAGTFNKNHLGMAVARAVLKYLKSQGPALQQHLNQRTSDLAIALNTYFEQEEVPIKIVYFGSLFRFAFSGNFDLLFYHLIYKGVYIWEGRNCFLSTAHTDEDIEYVIQAVKHSIEEMRAVGFIPKRSPKLSAGSNGNGTVKTTQNGVLTKPVVTESVPVLEAIAREGKLPLSLAQQRLWFLDQLEPNSAFYNIPAAVRLQGQLNVAILEQSFREIIRRHEALRTNFITLDGQPHQVIHPNLNWQISVVDLQHLPVSKRENESQKIAIAEAQRPFNLETESLVRATLLVLSQTEYILQVTMHHIVSDGWSMSILIEEFTALYTAFSQGQPTPLVELPIQYVDFAVWQRKWLQGTVLQSQLTYWKKQLSGAATILSLPTDRPRPTMQTVRGAHQPFALSFELTEALKALSKKEGVTLFMTVLAAYNILLYRYTGQADILVGSPNASRNRPEIQGLIGYFLNILLLRADMSGNPSLREFLKQVRKTALGAYAHQDVPVEELIEALQPVRDLSYTPLFQVMFILDSATPISEMQLPGVTWSSMTVENYTSKLDLTLTLENTAQGLVGEWEYNTDLFEAATITRMAEHFRNLLEGMVANPEQRIAELPLLAAWERQQLLVEWNNTQREYPHKCIHQLFEEQVELTPNAVAVVFGNQRLTYQELNSRANQLAHYLQELEIKPDTLIGICLERSLDIFVGILGILKTGAAYVPLDPDYPQERLDYMFSDSQVSILLTAKKLVTQIPRHSAQLVYLDADWDVIATKSQQNLASEVKPENLAYVIYTSGSTGRPKGVMVPHRSLVNAYFGWEQAYELRTKTSSHLQMANFSFDVFTGDLVRGLCSGAKLVLCPREWLLTPELLYKLMQEEKVDCAEFVPAVIRNLIAYLEKTKQNLDFMRVLAVGSDSWYVKEYEEFQRFCGLETRLINSYGVSEATIDSCYFESTNVKLPVEALVPIGKPFPNVQIYILDSDLQPVPIGVLGELYIGGAGLAHGYLNRPDLTQERFIANPLSNEPTSRLYKTGDLARFLADGNIEFLGRIDNQVKIRGFRIELAEIEAVLRQYPTVSQTVAMAREDIPGDKRLIAYVVGNQESVPVISDLRRFLKEKLPEYMIPAAFMVLQTIPLTPNGKVNYRELPAPEISRAGLEASFIAPRNPIEEILAQIWVDVLGVKQVGIHDNFFELGGHSLIATQLISRIRTALKVELPLRSLFEASTVADLAERIALQQDAPHLNAPSLQSVVRDGQLSLSFAQQRLWFLNQLEPNSALYNIAGTARLQGELNVIALEQSLGEIIRRHESLRTNFITQEDGQAVQIIRPDAAFTMPVVDLRQLSASEQEIEIQRLATVEAQQAFDLANQLLIRATLLVLSKTEHILLFCMHHIVSDGWSMGVFVQETAAIYGAFSQGQPTPLPELAIQYVDFAVWQRQLLQGEIKESQLAYWQQHLAGATALLELPTDRPRPAVQTFRGANQSFVLSFELTGSLILLSRQEGVTLFMMLLAAYDTLLYRYTGQTDILVGSAIANRNHNEIEGLIGFFVNTLVFRTDVAGNPSFRELLNRVREVALGAYSHQDLPFELLVETLQPERNLSYTPLFQVAFVLQNAPMSEIELPGLTLSSMTPDNKTAKFDLTLTLENTATGLMGVWEYNTDLFEASTIERMTGHFQTLLESVVIQPEQRIGELPLLTAKEQYQLLEEWNHTQKDYLGNICIHQFFEMQVERTPDAVALVFENQQLTYRELNQQANHLAHYLRTLGIRVDVLVGLCVERSLEMLVGLLGILKAGGAYVPIDPEYPQERISHILSDSQVSLLLTQHRLVARLPEHQATLVVIDESWEQIIQHSQENPISGVKDSDLVNVIYTSGSTGKPKGVMVKHSGLCNLAQAQIDLFDLLPSSRILQFASFSFDASIWEVVMALGSGARLYLGTKESLLPGLELIELLRDYGITHITLPPSALAVLPQAELPALQNIIVAGEACAPDLIKQWSVGRRFFNAYGPTETTVCATVAECGNGERSDKPPIGRPIPNTQAYILDSYLQPVPIGVPGELHIGGAGVAQGYLNRPELTTEKFILNPFEDSAALASPRASAEGSRLYKTGDLARYLPDGNIEYLGRIDNQVKVRGFRIELGEIEVILSQHPAALQVAVIAREDVPGDKRLVAYLVLNQEEAPTVNDLRQFLKQKLPNYMMPSAFVFLETLPITPNGKVDRRALPTPDLRCELEVSFVAPTTSIEETLGKIWADVLRVEQVGIHDNFFDLGGDSILSLQIIARANLAGLQLIPKQLFAHQTIAELAAVVGTTKKIQAEQGLVTGALLLTPIQEWFFEQNLPEPHHFNQSILLLVPPDVQSELLEQVLQKLLLHHDALRLRFIPDGGDWQQVNDGLEAKVPLNVIDLSTIPAEEQSVALENSGSALQASLNLSTGPLMRVALFKFSNNQPYRLLVILHHLIVDGVSWRILLEDLFSAYQQLSRGEMMALPPKTSSFKDWGHRLREYARSLALTSELNYWMQPNFNFTSLPTDYPVSKDANNIAATAQVSRSLSLEETSALLQEVPAAYNTQINDVLLTALLQSFAQWTGSSSLLIDIEGHGREELFDDLDLSRTVGWFTSLFPVRLQLEQTNHPGNILKSVKEQLRQLPNRGIGYGILRYLSPYAEQLKALPQAEVSFNYLGQLGQKSSAADTWKLAQESGGVEHNSLENRNYLLDINVLTINGKLQINWTYSQKIHQLKTVECLADWFMNALKTLINHCQSPDVGGYTSSDFPEVSLSQEEIDNLNLMFAFDPS
ncbi:hybrid non-ribosomal peptide synthetase/type I polyketide synthase [Nostoc punctiforme]|uniref:Amino acid adenylation domain protein n=1 Tax=Nostoc punctiforme (strain ATCC 29133 / PCC 73102) TaxID=63737 RepID=B2IXK1_NOSP7|nr:hybrid non-ribosomal peptide synthetase/type I polyketide synthase [Nostoc punctiforme]ACC81529.1 amino acid adenylation domain protein [Nostoc punctiforme PCC 73102]